MVERLNRLAIYFANFTKLVRLVWQTQPLIFVTILVLTIVQGGVPFANALWSKFLFDLLGQQIQGNNVVPPSQFVILLLFYLLINGVGRLFSPTIMYLNAELSRQMSLTIQGKVYGKMNSFVGLAYFEDPAFYDTIRMGQEGAELSTGQIVTAFTQTIQSVVTLIGFFTVFITLDPIFILLVTIALLPKLAAQLRFGQQRVGISFQMTPQERRKFYYSMLLTTVDFAAELRLFNLSDYFLNKLLHAQRERDGVERRQQRNELNWEAGLGLLSTMTAGGMLIVVIWQAVNGRLTVGDIAFYMSAIVSIQEALNQLIITISTFNESTLFYTHFDNLIALPEPLPISTMPQPVPTLQKGIQFRHVSFRYSEHHPWVLKDVNLTIPANQCVALVGLNGAGKTSLVKLLTRFYDPTEGQILWDGIDLRQFDPVALRYKMSAILQDFGKYDLSVRENIGLGDITQMSEMSSIQIAAEKVGIHQTLAKLPQGYDTLLSRMFMDEMDEEVGVSLSGGEWQKVAMARMFLRESDLLILDEPTAALDAEAEYEIYRQFSELVANRTSLLISHRFSTISMADMIAVLEDGEITECGSHVDLMHRRGTYARLYTMQATQYAPVGI